MNPEITPRPLEPRRRVLEFSQVSFQVLSAADVRTARPTEPHLFIRILSSWLQDKPEVLKALQLPDNAKRLASLDLVFDDINQPQTGQKVISVEDAKKILGFVAAHKNSAKLIVCCCVSGQGCSPAVAAALSNLLNDGNYQIFFQLFNPNTLVFKTISDAGATVFSKPPPSLGYR